MVERGRRGHRHAATGLGLSGAVLGSALALALAAAVGAGVLALHGHAAPAAAATEPVLSLTERDVVPPHQVATDPPISSPATAVATTATATPTPAPPADTRAAQEALRPATPIAAQPPAEPPAPLALAELLPTPSSALSAAPPALEREHKVSSGETLSGIAQRYGITPDTIVMNNAGVTDRDLLKVGQTLRIPPRDGLLYELRWGETLTGVAQRFGVEVTAIVQEPANRITAPDLVREGQVVFLPGVKLSPPPAPALAAGPRPTEAGGAAAVSGPGVSPGRGAGAPAPAPAPAAASQGRAGSGWIWPITGPISSYFGPSHPLGIDIDLYGRAGAPIVAARGGVVTFAGGNPCCSYGYYVEIDHGDGFRTLYAHLNAPPPVRIGQQVSQGQVIGYAGTTGYSTGVHLHFEIRRGGVPVNPFAYLP